MTALRFADGSPHTIEGLLCPYGGHAAGKDSYRTFFSPRSSFELSWYPEDARPVLFQHGLSEGTQTTPVGRVSALRTTDKGLWMQARLDEHNAYFGEIKKLVEAGAVGLSSGAMAHLCQIDEETGEILTWPLVEASITHTPSNLLAVIDRHTFKAHIRTAGIELPDDVLARLDEGEATRAVWSTAMQNDLPDSSFAFVEDGEKDSEGKTTPRSKRHLVYKDAEGKPDARHVRNALARLDQTDIPAEAKASARRKLVAAAKKLGIEVSDENATGRSAGALRLAGGDDEGAGDGAYDGSYEDLIDDLRALLNPANPFTSYGYTAITATYPAYVIACSCDGDGEETYWNVPWTLGDDGEPTLGTPQQVEQTYSPVARSGQAESSRSSSLPIGPLTLDAQHFIRQAAALARRTQDLGDRRIREGRVLSAANRTLLKDAHGRMGEAHRALGDLLDATEKQADDAARAARWADPVWRRQQFALLDLYAATCRT